MILRYYDEQVSLRAGEKPPSDDKAKDDEAEGDGAEDEQDEAAAPVADPA